MKRGAAVCKCLRSSKDPPTLSVCCDDCRSVRLLAGRFSYGLRTWPQWQNGGGCADRRGVRRAGNRGKSRWSFWWCRKPRSSCGTKPDGLPVQPWCGRPGRRPGSWLVPAKTQRTSLFAISALTFLEVTAEPFPQLQSGPQEPRFYRRNAELECFSCLLGRKPFYVAEDENRA